MVMSFLDIRFPESISFNSSTIVQFNTAVVQTKGGYEYRNARWSRGKMRFNVKNGIKTTAELDEMLTFFRNVMGKGYGFRYKDWSDYRAAGQNIGIGDGEKTSFQLVKQYAISTNIYTRTITKPVNQSVKIYFDSVETNDFSVDYLSGIISFPSPVEENTILTADFEFDVPVRFDSDELQIMMETLRSGKIDDIVLVECV